MSLKSKPKYFITLLLRNGKDMKTAIMLMIMLVLGAYPLYSSAADEPPPAPSQEQPEVLTSGPVHEAFAEPVNMQVQAGLVAPKEPPSNIMENAPAQRPVGEEFVLVPGYWAWDADRNDYIWVSACWRAAPPNMSWVPGYWSKVDGGWEWVAGFWTKGGAEEIEYLPAPPVLADVQPSGSPPSEDNIWVPSCQYWQEDHYAMRPGYWLTARQGWVWMPSHYIWTPRGYVFSPGHWDYSLERRGMLFAPVYFSPSLRIRAGFSFSPGIVISTGMLQVNLFTSPRYSHYYFGDYYDDAYLRIGIFPQFESERIHTWYDPIYVYDRWHNHRTEPRWEEYERKEYDRRRADKDLRPPKTYREMETRQTKMPEDQRNNIRMARPLTEAVASKATMRFEQIDTKTQHEIATKATEVQKFSDKRNHWESTPTTEKTAQPAKESKGTVTQPSEHKEPASASKEQKRSVTQPSEHKEPTSAPEEQKRSATQASEHKEPAPAPAEQKGSVTKPADNTPAVVSPREVKVTKPEKVKVPKSPVEGKSVDSSKSKESPPPAPAEERKQASDTKDKAKDKNKDKGSDKNKDN
jgi:hypothetical protein